jgi:hypothetical protein
MNLEGGSPDKDLSPKFGNKASSSDSDENVKYKRFKVVEIDSFPSLDEALEINYDLNQVTNI